MKLKLKLEAMKDAPRANGGKSAMPALGWSGGGIIHIVRWFDRHFFPTGRKAHEAEHELAQLGNEMHDGHTWHFCGRSWHAIRLLPLLHVSRGAAVVAHELNEDGQELDVQLDGTLAPAPKVDLYA